MATSAFDELKERAKDERSGEFIVASDDLEIHVYLQVGRVAWATSSNARFAFARYLANHCGVEGDTFRQVIAECQRTKKPLGETLIAWKLATPEQVRAALRSQVVVALSELAEITEVRALFLERGEAYREYTRDMTFDMAELEAALAGNSETGVIEAEEAETVRLLADSRRDLLWALMLGSDNQISARHVNVGELEDARVAAALNPFLQQDGTHVVVVHEPCGAIVGMPMPDGSSLWSALQVGGNVGAVIRELEKLTGRKSEAGGAIEERPEVDSIRAPELIGACAPLEAAIAKTPELGAVFLRRPDEKNLSVVRRKSFPLDPHESVAKLCCDLLGKHKAGLIDPANCPPGVVWSEAGVGLRVRIGGYWYCGLRNSSLCLWLVLSGGTNLGFCQALVDTLMRQATAAMSRQDQ